MVYSGIMLYAGILVTALVVGFLSLRGVNSRNCFMKAALYDYFLNSNKAKQALACCLLVLSAFFTFTPGKPLWNLGNRWPVKCFSEKVRVVHRYLVMMALGRGIYENAISTRAGVSTGRLRFRAGY